MNANHDEYLTVDVDPDHPDAITIPARYNDGPQAIIGGPDYALQIRHPDGSWLRIDWYGVTNLDA